MDEARETNEDESLPESKSDAVGVKQHPERWMGWWARRYVQPTCLQVSYVTQIFLFYLRPDFIHLYKTDEYVAYATCEAEGWDLLSSGAALWNNDWRVFE